MLNQLCHTYTYCVEDNVGEQDLSNCEGFVELWGEYYSIENTTEIDYDIFGGTMATEWTGWQAGDTIPREIGLLTNLTHLKMRGILRTTDYRYGNVIPEEICHLTNLEELDLSNNALAVSYTHLRAHET